MLKRILEIFAFAVFLSFHVYAQTSGEIISSHWYAVLNSGTSCVSQAYPRCIDTDGGYFPNLVSSVAGLVIPMAPTVFGQTTFWNPAVLQSQCIQSSEVCDNNGLLLEVFCGDVVGLNASSFSNFFPNHIWGVSIDTGVAALAGVNCTAFSMNHPYLNLQGICFNGACV